jgi:hypothetical protein
VALDEKVLELLREQSGLKLDADGHWWHRGEQVTHPRIAAKLHEGIGRAEDGRFIVQFLGQWAYIEVEDAPYVVRAARPVEERGRLQRFELRLSDDTVEPLNPATLALGRNGVLYCRAKDGAEPARFSRAAHVAVGARLRETPDGYELDVGGRTYPVAAR